MSATLAPPTRDAAVVCERCGAVWSRRTWRARPHLAALRPSRARWTVCPACRQAGNASGAGRVLLRGQFVGAHADEIQRRIARVADRAAHTQPQRRVVSITADADGIEVLTTSQKLAHRIVHELRKVFRGQATYAWADRDHTLFATWRRER